MENAKIALRFDQLASLRSVAEMTGRSESELVRSGVDFVIAKEVARAVREKGLAAMSQQAGMPEPVADIQQAWAELRERASKVAAG